MIKAVFFDWGHTITKSDFVDTEAKLNDLLEPYNLNWKSFYPFWRSVYILRSLGRIKSDEEMFDWLKKILQKDIPIKKLCEIRINSYIIPKENIETVKELKKDYKVGVLSNNVKEWVDRNLRDYKIEGLFDAVIISSEVGARKPNAEIYTAALKALSVKPEETVFIADEVAEDLVGAKGCGIKTIWLDTDLKKEWNKSDREIAELFKPDATVKNLKEVIPIIKNM